VAVRPRPTVLSLSVLVASGGLFGAALQGVVTHGGLAMADPTLFGDVLARRAGWLTTVALATTELGYGPLVYALLLATGSLLWHRRRDWRTPLLALAVLATGQLVRLAVMRAVRRMRPPQQFWLAQPDGFSFPSGHTTTATMGYILIAWLLAQLWPARRIPLFVGAAVVAAAVGLSRVYLGVHWPSDVLAGWALGLAWLSLAALAMPIWHFQRVHAHNRAG
jgi:membrane-associated phospholipid phosphatase